MAALPDISAHLPVRDGFCHPDWSAIGRIIEAAIPEPEWNTAWEEAARQWIGRLCRDLGGDYAPFETPNFLIMSAAPKRIVDDACRFSEYALKQILTNLAGIADDSGYGRHVVLMFANIDDYYGYISYFYPEGEHPMSGGVCLSGEGYSHFAFPTPDYSAHRSTLVHEMTHECLSHLPLPAWLHEALAMRMEDAICESRSLMLDREIYERHEQHWNPQTIQQFWSGASWDLSGESFELSYSLAQILWRKLEVDLHPPREVLLTFLSAANAQDAGESACRDTFQVGLADLVEDFLGRGDWNPKPRKWKIEANR